MAGEQFREQYEALQLEIMQPTSLAASAPVTDGRGQGSHLLSAEDEHLLAVASNPGTLQTVRTDAQHDNPRLLQRDVCVPGEHVDVCIPGEQVDAAADRQAALESATAGADALRADLGDLQAAHDETLACVDSLRALTNELEQRLATAEAAAATEREAKLVAIDALEDLQSTASKEAEYHRLELEMRARESDARFADLLVVNSGIQGSHLELQSAYDSLQASHKELEYSREQLNRTLSELEVRHAAVKDDLARLEEEHSRVLGTYSDLVAKHSELEAADAELKVRCSILEAEKAAVLPKAVEATGTLMEAECSSRLQLSPAEAGMGAVRTLDFIGHQEVGSHGDRTLGKHRSLPPVAEIHDRIGSTVMRQVLALGEASLCIQGW